MANKNKNEALVKALLNLTAPKIDNSKMANQLKGFPQGMGSKQGVYKLPADYNVKNEIKDAALLANSFAPVTGDIQSGVMAAQDLAKGNYGSAALNGLGLLPFVPAMAGTFIGKGAKTWDAVNASKAMKMADKGIDERTIWEKTGTFKGADGQWRQEISDHTASINKSALPNRIINGMKVEDWKVNDALNHQPLYEAYPSIANIESSFQNKGGASYNPLMDWISYSDRMKNPLLSIKQKQEIAQSKGAFDALHSSPEYKRYDDVTTKAFDLNPNITDAEFNAIHNAHNGDYLTQESSRLFNQYQKVKDNYMANPMGGNSLGDDIGMPAKAVTLHELQHAIQHREGFAQGGSPEAMREDALAMLRRDVASGEIPSTEQAMAMLPDAQLNAYKRLAGEAEARATESRMKLTPKERRALFPFDSYDVPRESLIVRGLL